MNRLTLLLLAGVCLLVPTVVAQTSGAPTVASLSNSQTLTEGQSVTLSVSVNGTAPFSYQWRKGGTAITGATNSTLAFDPIRATDAGTYSVTITNAVGSVTSGPVILAVNPAVAPTLYYQPGPVTFVVGDTLSLYMSASGTEPLTFVWKRGTTTVATTNSSYYSKANVQTTDAGTYTVTVSNVAGSVTSSPFTVTVNPVTAPTFSYNLSDVTVATGGSIYFYPSVNGSGTITYQWKKDGVSIPGATNHYYNKYDAQASDAGNYSLTATNSAGSTTSNSAKVTVLAPVAPTISSVSGAVSVVAGESFSLSVYANGTTPLTYQWRKDGQAIAGATGNHYSKSNAQTADAGAYTVVVSNSQGSVTSATMPVTITNARPPIITYHPASLAVRLGEYIGSISVGASGSGSLAYQWSKNGVAITGANSSSLYFGQAVTSADAGTYTVVVSSAQGSATSEPCHLAVLPAAAPTLTSQLPSQTVRQGETISLQASVSGTPPPTIQWRKDGVSVPGATNYYYYKSNAASSDAGSYSFVATNSAGTATSDNATITILASGGPKIVAHPASASLLPGDSFYGMFVGISSNSNATVQWYRDAVLIPGATSSYYSIYNAQPSAAGTYTAVVTNTAGSATSREAVITVDANTTRPVITYVQGSRAVRGGDGVTINIATSSSGEAVQWYKDGVIIANATSKDYWFSNFAVTSAGTYTAQVTNASGTFTSRPIVLELLDAGVAPFIMVQPLGQTVAPGSHAGFSVTAEGEAPLSFQWRKDGAALTGATSSYYNVSNITTAHAGAYSVVVSNRNGNVTSSAAALTVNSAVTTAPVITRHPASQTVTTGSGYVGLGVNVLVSTGVTYQWRKDGVAISGATSSTLSYYTVDAAVAGRYSVVATNAAGTATSYDAIVSVTSSATGPTFTMQPKDIDAYYGNTVTFTSSATGASAVTYQWRKNGVAIPGATNSSLTLANAQSSAAATYTVVATDSNGSTPSVAVTLALSGGVAPFIVTNPASVTALAGTAATFSASVGGTPVPTVQWQKNGADIGGASTLQLSINSVQAGDAGTYTLVARSAVGTVTSQPATLTVVHSPPTIVAQPAAVNVPSGGSATFSVTVNSVPEPAYQWRKDGVALPGATSRTLTLANVQGSHGGRYSVIVTTAFGSVTSVEALLTIGSPVTVTVPQTIVANVGGSATIAATVVASDPLVFRWARNGAVIPGATTSTLTFPSVQLSDVGTYVLGVSRPDGTVLYPLTGSGALMTLLTANPKFPPTITQQPVGATAAIGSTVTLSVRAHDNGPITYQWQKNGVPMPDVFGDTLVLTNVQPSDAADYRVVVMGIDGFTPSVLVRVAVTGSSSAGTFFGTFANGDGWALHVREDGSGVFVALLSSRGQVIVERNVIVQPSGAFRFGSPRPVAASGASPFATRYYDGEVNGLITAGTAVSGHIPGANLPLFGGRLEAAGQPPAPAGYFEAVPLASGLGELAAIAAPDGSLLLVAVDAAGVRGGRGSVDTTGFFTVTQPQYVYRGQINPAGSNVQGVYAPGVGEHVSFATPAAPAGSERLVNVATRGLAGAGARTLTAGFVISGSTAKEVLIRAVGPTLTGFGVTGVLPNPRLRIFKDGTPVVENDDWGFSGLSSQIIEASARVGAFALPVGSVDAAILTRLDPGAYTAQISSDADASGVALVEVYDTAMPVAGAPKLVNLSTRGEVGRDGDILIVGVVVSGTAPKKLLIRGIGPTLGQFGVSGALADPRLQLFRGDVMIRENDNWPDAADVVSLITTAAAVGAFELPPGSKDAALLLYLPPGSYTAQVSGVGNTTGVALVEAYEVP